MKHYKEVDVPATVRKVETHVTCDRCGNLIPPVKQFDVNENTIEFRRGENYPEGGSGKSLEIELCNDCVDLLIQWVFVNKHIVWLDWDW